MESMPLLGVNIDHVATVREARKTNEPDPVWAATLGRTWAGPMRSRSTFAKIAGISRSAICACLIESVAVPINLELGLRRRCARDRLRDHAPIRRRSFPSGAKK